MSKEKKKKGIKTGPDIIIDWKEVHRLAEKLSKGKEIAARLQISYRTLTDRFRSEHAPTLDGEFPNFSSFLRYKRQVAYSKLKETALESALSPLGVTDRIFLLKALCGLSDRPKQEKEAHSTQNITVNFTPPTEKNEGDQWEDE